MFTIDKGISARYFLFIEALNNNLQIDGHL